MTESLPPLARRLPLTGGTYILLDEADYQRLKDREICVWHGYVAIKVHRRTGDLEIVSAVPLHRFLVGFPKGKDVRFRNGNRRDFRRSNLEVVARAATGPAPLPSTCKASSDDAVWIPEYSAWSPAWQAKDERWRYVLDLQLFELEDDAIAEQMRWQAERLKRKQSMLTPIPAFTSKSVPPVPATAIRKRLKSQLTGGKIALYWGDAPTKTTWGQSPKVISDRLVHVAILHLCNLKGVDACDVRREDVRDLIGIDEDTIGSAVKRLEDAGVIDVERRQEDPRAHGDGRTYAKRLPLICTLKNPVKVGRCGLFPAKLLGDETFTDLEKTAKYILVTLYMMAEGKSHYAFRLQDLHEAACLADRATLLKALDALREAGYIRFFNPCAGAGKSYKDCDLEVDFIV